MKNTSKKSLFMVAYTDYPSDTRVRREAEALASSNEYGVTVLVPKALDESKSYFLQGVRIVELNQTRYKGKSLVAYLLSYIQFCLSALAALTRFTLHGTLDMVHVHNMPNFLVFSATIPRLLGKTVILDIHDTVPETYIAKFENQSGFLFRLFCLEESISCAFAQKIICVNHPQKDILIKRGIAAEKISVILNVPDPKWFSSQASASSDGKNERFNLVYHGTIAKRLGVDLTIRAVAKLADKIPWISFHVFGKGEDLEECIALTKNLELERRVHFHHLVPLEKLADELKDMDLGVISNRKNIATELMLPVKMLEYISLGIPVVAPRLRTIQFYFSEDTISYYESEDLESLMNVLNEAYLHRKNRSLRTQKARIFFEKYDWAVHKEDLLNLYRSLSA